PPWSAPTGLRTPKVALELRSDSNFAEIATLPVDLDGDLANAGRQIVRQLEQYLRKVAAGGYCAHIYGRHVKVLIITVDQIHYYIRRGLTLTQPQVLSKD